MKNKTVQRVLSFCLALLLCFTWNIAEPLVANAFAIELGWVTWALISFMAASGFTFAVAGGIDALKAEVDEKVDTYYQVKGIDLYQLIAQSLRFNNNNNGQPGFWFTIAAITAIREFLVWLKSDQLWEPGEHSFEALDIKIHLKKYTNGEVSTLELDNTFYNGSECLKLGTVLDYSEFTFTKDSSNNVLNGIEILDGTKKWYPLISHKSTNYSLARMLVGSGYSGSIYGASINITSSLNNAGYTNANVVGYTFSITGDNNNTISPSIKIFAVMDDGKLVYITFLSCSSSQVHSSSSDVTITVPETTPEFDVEENQYVEISFDAFPDNVTYETPEEFAEAVKQQVIDTGTVPNIKTEVVTDPDADPQPSPVIPPPDQTDPNYPDVGELGLPSLGDALKSKFPFSLPWTFGAILGIFLAPRQTPKWEVDLPAPLSTSFTIDLSPYEEVGYVSRWMSDIGYAIALLLATRKFIHW